MTPATYAALSAESGLTLQASDEQRVIETLRGDVDSWRLMYRAAFDAAVASRETIAKQQECIAELRETIARMTRSSFPVETR